MEQGITPYNEGEPNEQQRIARLETDNNRLVEELELYRQENSVLKKLQEQTSLIDETSRPSETSHEDRGESFLKTLADLVNTSCFNHLIVQDAMFAVVELDWDQMIDKNGREEPFMKFIGYSPSRQLDLCKLMNVESLIGMEDPDSGGIRKGIYKAMEASNFSVETDILKEYVPKEAFGVGFQSTTLAIRDEKGKVIGGFGIATHLDVYSELNGFFTHISKVMAEVMSSGSELFSAGFKGQLDSLSKVITELNDHSRSAKDGLGLVEAVADQTKILSFNATIESARAGVHGKGFAVVSGEIRKLADKTKSSIDHITSLIKQIFDDILVITNIEQQFSIQLKNRLEQAQAQAKLMEKVDDHLKDMMKLNANLQDQFIRK